MKRRFFPVLGLVIALTLAACGSNNSDTTNSNDATNNTQQTEKLGSGSNLVKFPENYAEGVLYATVTRGNVKEDLYTSREAIEAVQKGQPIPSGTVITLVDYRDGELYRYFVMEKRTGWGAQYPPEDRNGEWEYQSFRADKSVNEKDDIGRCFSCHANQDSQEFVNTYDRMKSYDVESLTGAIPAEDWEVQMIADHSDDQQGLSVGDEEKEGVIRKALLGMYLQ